MSRLKSRHTMFDRFLEQEKTPTFTATSVLTTVVVWMIVTMDLLHAPHDWGGLAQFFLLVFVLGIGLLVNAVIGGIASSRGEYCGGRIAAFGIGLWFVTVAFFFFVRGNRLWPYAQ